MLGFVGEDIILPHVIRQVGVGRHRSSTVFVREDDILPYNKSFSLSKPFPFFLSKELQKEPKRPFCGALPVDFWMLNFCEIQHRVASLTLECTTTFTRHHAFLKRLERNFRERLSVWWRPRIAVKGSFARPKYPKSRESCLEIAKNADFSTFSKIKVVKYSLLFAKVVLLYKVRNFAEHLRIFPTFFVFNKIL